ncbi:hypothetical protein [Draconibacterium sp.]|uniref:hypothetical protein n=1 Tax=Draconibacterium sp. TaxID=1965318 RepID=UPI00356255F9
MANPNIKSKTIQAARDTIILFNECNASSGANSQGEFLQMLLERWTQDDPAPKVEKETVTVEKELTKNQLLINLLPAQEFALRSNVLSPDFAKRQNELIDTLKGTRPFLYFGSLYDPELQKLWVRNIVVTKQMTEAEKEAAIKHNMSAFLVNMYLMHAIDGNLSSISITADSIKEFIAKEAIKGKQPQKSEDNGI